MTQFSIPVIEYESNSGNAIKPLPPAFVFNDRQLLVAMIRSTLTKNSGREIRKYLAAIMRPTLQFLVDWNHSPNLRLSANFLGALRDFSAKTRIGELAQGVSYAYWKWDRGYSWIADFEPVVKGIYSPIAPTNYPRRTPDFVMLNLATNDLAVMESKGTSSNSYKSPMRSALDQCTQARNYFSFSRGFGTVLTLDAKNPLGNATLHIRDPENYSYLSDKNKHYWFCRSYASWFELIGDDDLANYYRQEEFYLQERSVTRQRISREFNDTNPLFRNILAEALGFEPSRTRFVIDSEIAKAITDFESFKHINWQDFSQSLKESSGFTSRSMRFPDGTMIMEE